MKNINGIIPRAGGVKLKNFVNRSPVEAVRQCLLEESNPSRGGRKIGMDSEVFAFISRLVTMRDESDPGSSTRDTFDLALASIDQNKNTVVAARLVPELGRTRGHADRRWHQRRLDQTLVHIRESCENTLYLEVPVEMTREEMLEAVAALSRSSELIARLMTKLLGRGEES